MSILDSMTAFLDDNSLPVYLGGQAASVGLRKQADDRVRRRQEELRQQELARQRAYADQARARVQQSTAAMAPDQVEGRRLAAEQRIEAAATPESGSSVLKNYQAAVAGEQPAVVGEGIARRMSDAMRENDDYRHKLARAQSYGTSMGDTNRLISKSGNDVNSIARNAEFSRSILPYELEDAVSRGAHERTLSDIVGGVSNLAGLYGITRKPKPKPAAPAGGETFSYGGDQSLYWPGPY